MPAVRAIKLSRDRIRQMVRQTAEDSSRVIFTKHAFEKMRERKITVTEVLRCLRKGLVREGPTEEIRGGWRLTLEVLSAGEPVAVVAVLSHDSDGNLVVVVTTYSVRK